MCSAVGSGSPSAILVVHSLVLAGISQIHTRQAFLGAWQAEQSTNKAYFSYTSHFYLFELIYYVVKAILFVESQRAIIMRIKARSIMSILNADIVRWAGLTKYVSYSIACSGYHNFARDVRLRKQWPSRS